MVLEIIANFLAAADNTILGIFIIVIFVLFVVLIKKAFSIIVNGLIVVVASVLFPIVANRFLGLTVPTDLNSLISFVSLGIGLYLIYLLARGIYGALGIAEKALGAVTFPFRIRSRRKKEKMQKKMEEIVKQKEKEEKKMKEENKQSKEENTSTEKNYVFLEEPVNKKKKIKSKRAANKKKASPLEPIPVIDED